MVYEVKGIQFDTTEPELVEPAFGCPKCGTCVADYLLIDDDNVHCLNCDHKYNVGGKV